MKTEAAVLPPITGEYQLAPEQIASFQRNGHILLKGVVSTEEIAAWRNAINEVVAEATTEKRPLNERDTYGKAFLQIGNLWQRSEILRPFLLSERFARIASELLQADGVRLYHDQALFKEPGGGFTPWHQDQYYWPLDGVKTVTMWMPLVDVPVEMGAMTFASESHQENFLGHIKISDESEQYFDNFIKEKGYTLESAPLAAGDATFHTGWTLHGASGNNTDRVREVQTIIYFEADAIISEPDNPNREADLKCWFPGLKPGDKAASRLNPLLWKS